MHYNSLCILYIFCIYTHAGLLISEDILTWIDTIIIIYCKEGKFKIIIIFKPSPPGKITLFLPWAIGTPNDTRKISFYQNGTIADGIMPIKKCMFDCEYLAHVCNHVHYILHNIEQILCNIYLLLLYVMYIYTTMNYYIINVRTHSS